MLEYQLASIDLIVIALYAIAIMLFGVFLGRKYKNVNDYFLVARSMTWPPIGISLFASNILSTTLIGLAGNA